ncbi:hypothetical protein KBC85_01615 [Candidatus Saccharibacteria bacterium]|nr:hypothetical protein [Candidatus Saccharibacteria bacterium]MDQ5884944.1 hypothetical protein [Patescibacteria group bacterium]MDQ5953596.1 hypothetical protein [Patescibacteria group bacterium]MDQ5969947.1 hypothetical protein [Patescibacteria group bacterium]
MSDNNKSILTEFAQRLVDEVYPDITPELKDRIVLEITELAEKYTQAELINRIPTDKLEEFDTYMDTNPSQSDVIAKIQSYGVDTSDVVKVVFQNIRQNYIG